MIHEKNSVIRQLIINFLVVSACITAAMGIMGVLFAPEQQVGYGNFFAPFLFAAVSMFPSIVYYSRKVLSRRQSIIRMILHLLLLEAAILTFAFFMGSMANSEGRNAPAVFKLGTVNILEGQSAEIIIALAVSVLIIDVTVTLLMKANANRVAEEFNTALRRIQEMKE